MKSLNKALRLENECAASHCNIKVSEADEEAQATSSLADETSPALAADAVARHLHQAYSRLSQLNLTPVQAGGVLLLSIQKEKLAQAHRGTQVDASWQASVSWAASLLHDVEDGLPIARSMSMAMTPNIDFKTAQCVREIESIEQQIRLLGMHHRDRMLIRILSAESIPNLAGQPCRVSVSVARKPVDGVHHHFELVDHRKNLLINKMNGTLGKVAFFNEVLSWPGERTVRALFQTLQSEVRQNPDIQEVTYFYEDDELARKQALSLAHVMAILWNMPCLDNGDFDPILHEAARRGMVKTLKSSAS